ncbi:hypothetical protein VAWG006_15540 [Aeromonas enteropelogenes]|nr:hypothetical protein VAWG006_15540 [Aeromonas enteropelogenes]BEE21465.1 hypothetical protein VAWG007_15600 [Aeromonas enteropelogenes]
MTRFIPCIDSIRTQEGAILDGVKNNEANIVSTGDHSTAVDPASCTRSGK